MQRPACTQAIPECLKLLAASRIAQAEPAMTPAATSRLLAVAPALHEPRHRLGGIARRTGSQIAHLVEKVLKGRRRGPAARRRYTGCCWSRERPRGGRHPAAAGTGADDNRRPSTELRAGAIVCMPPAADKPARQHFPPDAIELPRRPEGVAGRRPAPPTGYGMGRRSSRTSASPRAVSSTCPASRDPRGLHRRRRR